MLRKTIVIISFFCGFVVLGDEPQKTVALSKVPAAAQKTIQSQVTGGQISAIHQTPGSGETDYDVESTGKDGQEHNFTVADDGTLASIEVEPAELSASAKQAVKSLIRDGTLEGIDKNLDDVETDFGVEWTTKDGRDRDATIAGDGTLLNMEVSSNEIPGAVQKTIAARMNGGTLESIDEDFDDTGTNFDVEIKATGGHKKSFTVAPDGGLLSEEVNRNQVNPAAMKTIESKIGSGRILGIDRSFVKREGILPFEVEGRKDGKPFDFSVGPRGRFLGMDD